MESDAPQTTLSLSVQALTALLSDAASSGAPPAVRREALERLLPLVYDELRRLAGRYLSRERTGHTLQPTALVHEAFLRITGQEQAWQNRAHFLGVSAQLMRRILIDHARAKKAEKRGGSERLQVTLNEGLVGGGDHGIDVIELDDALKKLAEMSERQAKVVELRCFGGLNNEETAEAIGIAVATVKRDWTLARAWLLRELSGSGV